MALMLKTKIIVIGFNDRDKKQSQQDAMSLLSSGIWLHMNRGHDLIKRLRIPGGDCESYDMETHPERGDALDHIDESTLLVVSLHVCGLTKHENPQLPTGKAKTRKQYCYDLNNYSLIDMCMKVGAMLIVWGEQPDYWTGATATQINGQDPHRGGPTGYIYEPGGKTSADWEKLTLDDLRARADGYSHPKYANEVEATKKQLAKIMRDAKKKQKSLVEK
jgi:hypothetical protein